METNRQTSEVKTLPLPSYGGGKK